MVTEQAKELIVDVMLNHYKLGEFYVREMGNFHLSTEWVIDNFRVIDNFLKSHPRFILIIEEGEYYITEEYAGVDDNPKRVVEQLVVNPDNIELLVVRSRLDGLLFDYSFDTSEFGKEKLYDKWLRKYEDKYVLDNEQDIWFCKYTLKELLRVYLKTRAREFRDE